MHTIVTLRSPLSPSPPPSPTKSSPRRLPTALGNGPDLPRLSVTCQAACQAQPFADIGLRSPPPSLYDVLRVKRSATMTEIKYAYRTLAKLCHPDALGRSDGELGGSAAGGTGGRDFIVLHNAYATLSDPAARARYDVSLVGAARVAERGLGATPGFGMRTRRWETDQCW
ncbi:hypothetical protein MLD38_012780 [Melastoma candidum]|uniref:Uncharacterized protein n=1 Tax=Melastoma candidum TaxID=119954 RepID=A0ACB9R7E7_9MYRT|nr:hypothetical protein MLD38_012780 [Melastoma candidum]